MPTKRTFPSSFSFCSAGSVCSSSRSTLGQNSGSWICIESTQSRRSRLSESSAAWYVFSYEKSNIPSASFSYRPIFVVM